MTVENIAYYPPTPKYPKPFEQIVNALIAKMRQGVRVRVITPGCDLNPWNPGYNMDALNAQPSRLDLTDIYARLAAERGIKFAISTDSHHTSQLQFMRYGIDVARRAWLQKTDVINTLPLQQFLKSLATSRNAPI